MSKRTRSLVVIALAWSVLVAPTSRVAHAQQIARVGVASPSPVAAPPRIFLTPSEALASANVASARLLSRGAPGKEIKLSSEAQVALIVGAVIVGFALLLGVVFVARGGGSMSSPRIGS